MTRPAPQPDEPQGGADFFLDAFPVAALRPPPFFDDAAVAQMDRWVRGLWADERQYALVVVNNHAGSLTDPFQRKRLATWINQPAIREGSARWCVGVSTVVESTMLRGVLTAFLWLYNPPLPLTVARTIDEAIDQALGHLATQAIDPGRDPEDVRRMIHSFAARLS